MQTLLWPDEVRPTAGLAPEAPQIRPQELQMAKVLLEQLGQNFR